MFKVSITKDGIETNGAQFETPEVAQAWILENHEYFPADYISEITDITEAVALEKQKTEALSYLAKTDWYIVRFMETGVAVPDTVSALRAEARLKA